LAFTAAISQDYFHFHGIAALSSGQEIRLGQAKHRANNQIALAAESLVDLTTVASHIKCPWLQPTHCGQ